MFGRAIARQVAEIAERLGRPERFVLREHGAGSGALGVAILEGLRREAPEIATAVRYQPVESAAVRLAAIEELLAGRGLAEHLEAATGDVSGVILANELLDALPAHRVQRDMAGRLREVFVGLDSAGALVDVIGAPSTPQLEERLTAEGVVLQRGQRAEICLATEPWVAEVAASLERGVLLLIDYGYPAEALYDPRERPAGTLRAYVRHRVHADPYRHLGRQDLTTHVDLTAVERAAAAARLTPLGSTTQARFLLALGVGELLAALEADAGTDLQAALEARAALRRMLDPRVTGRFAVLGHGRGLAPEPPLRGFSRAAMQG
ncbi:MAG: SAM-dependent methyltransferase [Chloroflexi bacterium]|nr:SAM-dependent methyltransferase [Chloroflexota bacterium]